jgi:hypothetical protein
MKSCIAVGDNQQAIFGALLRLVKGAGVCNLAEDDRAVSVAKARRELGFDLARGYRAHRAPASRRGNAKLCLNGPQ